MMDLIQMRKQNFVQWKMNVKKLSRKSGKSMVAELKAAYGCSLGGSFVSLLIQRKRIHIDHGIIGSSDMDEAGSFMARILVIDSCADYV